MQHSPPQTGRAWLVPALAGKAAVTGALLIWLWWALALPPVPPLTSPHAPAAPLTGLCILLLGQALILRRRMAINPRLRLVGTALALVAGLLACLALAQALTGRDLGIDTWLFRDAVLRARAVTPPSAAQLPGRMSATAAATALSLAAALLLVHHRSWLRWVACGSVLLALLITFSSWLLQLYGAQPQYAQLLAPMTAGTALLYSALAVGTLFIYRSDGVIGLMLASDSAGLVARRLVLSVLALGPLVGLAALERMRAGVSLEVGVSAMVVAAIVIVTGLTLSATSTMRAIDKRRVAAESDLQQLAEQRRRMLDVGQSLVSALSAEAVVSRLQDSLPSVVHHTWFGLYELDAPAGVLRPLSEGAVDAQLIAAAGWPIPVDRSISGEAVRERQALLVNHAERDPRSAYPPGWITPVEHLIAVPLLSSDAVFGTLVVARDEDPPFSDAEFESVRFLAGYAALALANARLFEQATRSEERAREREEMLRAIGDNLPTGVIYQLVRESEDSIRYTYMSTASERLGMSAEDLYANPNLPKLLVHPEDMERYKEANRRAFQSNAPLDITVRRYRPDGALRWHRISSQPRRLASGEVVWDGITFDITEHKEAEAALQAANQALQQRVGELAALNQIAQSLTQWVDLPTALRGAALAMRGLFGQAAITLWQVDDQRVLLIPLTVVSGPAARAAGPPAPLPLSPAIACLLESPPRRLAGDEARDTIAGALRESPEVEATAAMLVPLVALGQPIGLLQVCSQQPGREFSAVEQAVAETIASTLANAIDNARLFAQAQISAAEEERRRLARDLHDSVSQALFAAARIAATLPQTWELDPEEGREALGELRRLTAAALAEMRALLVELRPKDLVEAPLHEVFEHLVPLITTRSTAAIDTSLQPIPLLPADVQVALYRLTQEALNNVSKHAHAQKVAVSLEATPAYQPGQPWRGAVTVRVADDGRGFDPGERRPGHLGLPLMQERASAIGAQLAVVSSLGAGTQVTITWRGSGAPALQPAHGL